MKADYVRLKITIVNIHVETHVKTTPSYFNTVNITI